jgi:hypothetical protein
MTTTARPSGLRLTKTQREKLATLGQRYIKSADPTVTDDSSAGYGVWDKWLNQTSGEAYVCLDATAGAADWQNISLDADDLAGLFDAKQNKLEWERKTANFTAESGKGYAVAAGITATLPASPTDKDRIWFSPLGDMAASNGTVARNGKKIMGSETDLTWDSNIGFSLIYDDTDGDWRIAS